jgi:hypothetical protein
MITLPRAIAVSTAALAIALLAPRLMIFQSLCSRAYECASLHRAVQGPFRAGFIHGGKICGDLATMANRPDLCSYRDEIFEIDPWGYRNTLDVWMRPNDVLIFGDSFALGQGVNQDQTPSVQLSRISGHSVYDGAGKFEFNYLHWLIDHLKTKPKVVVFLHLERHHHTPIEVNDWDKVIDENSFSAKWKIFWESEKNYNPFKIIASRLDKNYLTPQVFPNRYGESVPVYKLKTGREFLFLNSSVAQYDDRRTPAFISGEGDFFEGLRAKLAEQKIELIVTLVPEKYSVYAPLLIDPPKPVINPSIDKPAYLDLLADELARRKLKYINLLPILKKEAMAASVRSEYIYWTDDTHWNARGIFTAMTAINSALPK